MKNHQSASPLCKHTHVGLSRHGHQRLLLIECWQNRSQEAFEGPEGFIAVKNVGYHARDGTLQVVQALRWRPDDFLKGAGSVEVV